MPYNSEIYTMLNMNTYISYNIQFTNGKIGSKSDNLVILIENCDNIFIISTF